MTKTILTAFFLRYGVYIGYVGRCRTSDHWRNGSRDPETRS